MDLKSFALETVKHGAAKAGLIRSVGSQAWKWISSSPAKVGKDVPGAAKKVVERAGKNLSKDDLWNLRYISAGKPWKTPEEAKKYVQKKLKEHGVRQTSYAKPLLLGGAGIGAVAGVSSSRKQRPSAVHLMDRSPQLAQNTSRVVY